MAPFAAILSNALGVYGGVSTGVLAVFIIFGTVNAYTTGMSRVVYSLAKEGGLPKSVARIHPKTGVPHLSLGLLSGFSLITLVASYFLNIDLQTALLIPSGAAILVYTLPRWRERSRQAAHTPMATAPELDAAEAQRLRDDLAAFD